jgi:hypothetical protein
MTPTLTEETRRRLALGLFIHPRHRNRRRHHRMNIYTLAIGSAILAAIIAYVRI